MSFDHVTPRAFKVHAMRDVHLKYSRAFKQGPLLWGNSFYTDYQERKLIKTLSSYQWIQISVAVFNASDD